MADIRVTCPMCKTQLEIDAAHEGEEVECGNCLQVFVATTKKGRDVGSGASGSGSRSSGATRSRASRDDDDDRPRRRQRDDDDDYDDDDYYDRPRRRQAGNGLAVTSLVLGGISVVTLFGPFAAGNQIPLAAVCGIGLLSFGSSIGAIITGAIGMRNPEGKGMATTGLVLGVLTLAIFMVQFIIGFIIGFNAAMNGNPPPNKFR